MVLLMISESTMRMQVNFDCFPLHLLYPRDLPELQSFAGSLSDLYLLEEDATPRLASEHHATQSDGERVK